MSAERLPVGSVEDFEPNVFRTVEIPGGSIGVVRTERGFFAIRNRCPHQGAELCAGRVTSTSVPSRAPFSYETGLEDMVVRCPWHRWEFSVDSGEAVGRTTTKKVVTYPVEVEAGEVYVMRRAKVRATAKAGRA